MPKKVRYADGAKTPVETTQTEIRKIILEKMGGTQLNFGYDAEHGREYVSFKAKGMPAVLSLPLMKEERERIRLWRCMLLHVKNMWVSIEIGITTLEQTLIPYFLLPNHKTLGETLPPLIRQAIATGKIPALLPGMPFDE